MCFYFLQMTGFSVRAAKLKGTKFSVNKQQKITTALLYGKNLQSGRESCDTCVRMACPAHDKIDSIWLKSDTWHRQVFAFLEDTGESKSKSALRTSSSIPKGAGQRTGLWTDGSDHRWLWLLVIRQLPAT